MFEILCAGCDYPHEKDFEINRKNGYPHYLALFIKTPGILIVNGEKKSFPKGTFILFDKNSPHYYAADNTPYIDDWIQFECSENYLSEFKDCLNKPVVVNDFEAIESYFKLILRTFFRGISNNNIIDHLILALFSEAFTWHIPDYNVPHFEQLNRLRHNIHKNPHKNWTIREMADSINLSEAYLQELYKKTFGISCITEVIQSRVLLSKNLLTSTTKSIQQIADDCGYNNVVHFSRQFKAEVGVSPIAWRKKQSN